MNRSLLAGTFATLTLLLSACAADTATLEEGSAGPNATENVEEAKSAWLSGYTTALYSEELSPAYCANGHIIDAMRTTGSNSDNIALHCGFIDRNFTPQGGLTYVSEEQPNGFKCPSNQFAAGIYCQGSYCDQVALQCGTFAGTTRGVSTSCYWTPWFSEEQEWAILEPNRAVAGIKCRGSYCDDMSLYSCPYYL